MMEVYPASEAFIAVGSRPWRLDEGDAFELLGNLMDNAANWSQRVVRVSLWLEGGTSGGTLRLRVDDDGPGFTGDTAAILQLRREWANPRQLEARSVLFLVLSGLATGASWLCYYRALQLGPAARVAPVDKLSVVFVLVFAALFLGEALTLKIAVGGLLISAGAILIALG